MVSSLSWLLAREQRAFLGRSGPAWEGHLSRARAFLGEGFRRAEPERGVLILGAGSGLEVPWREAPPGTVGWDADPWSRARTFIRHGRWAPWVFEDATGALGPLVDTTARCVQESWSGRRRSREVARKRLAGLLDSLCPDPAPLRDWLTKHRPGTILAANWMGQIGEVARRRVEEVFSPDDPWEEDPEVRDCLEEALSQWTRRTIEAFLACLASSDACLWLLHDRAILDPDAKVHLGTFSPRWEVQVEGCDGTLEVGDPLAGVDVPTLLNPRRILQGARWVWRLDPSQCHLMEALAFDRVL